jgi:paraquat-inducible protein A
MGGGFVFGCHPKTLKKVARMSEAHATLSGTVHECHECGLVQTVRDDIKAGMSVSCRGCGCHILSASSLSLERALAYAVGALILFVIANVFPFMSFEMNGRVQESLLISGVLEFYNRGFTELAIIVFLAAILLPCCLILAHIALLAPVNMGRIPPYIPRLLRILQSMRPWAMAEVFVFGVFVAYVKLSDLALLGIGPGCYAFLAMVLLVMAADSNIDPHSIWNRVMRSTRAVLAKNLNQKDAAGCHICGLVCHTPAHSRRTELDCPRCGTEIHHRKPNSLARTWALLIAAAICYIPANTYPMLTVISFGKGSPSTIFGGVVELIEADMYPIAAIVFFASILVPCLKLVGICYLLISVQIKSTWRPKDRTVLYRIIEFIGRWSMIDIFMISILIALVQLGAIATIDPGPAAIAFCAVVILTMLASMSFDPRLIWDATKTGLEGNGVRQSRGYGSS